MAQGPQIEAAEKVSFHYDFMFQASEIIIFIKSKLKSKVHSLLRQAIDFKVYLTIFFSQIFDGYFENFILNEHLKIEFFCIGK